MTSGLKNVERPLGRRYRWYRLYLVFYTDETAVIYFGF